MELVNTGQVSDAYRQGAKEGRTRLAGVAAQERSQDELKGLLMALETVANQLRSQLTKSRQEKNQFQLRIIK